MDWSKWLSSVGAVYVFTFFSGWLISWISGYMNCSKSNVGENAKQGAIWGAYPTIVYALSTYFERVRSPFVNTLSSFGVSENIKEVVGVGYLLMLSVWIGTVWNIHNTTKAVCVPSVDEMSAFKTNLINKLKKKQEEEEAEKQKKTSATA